MGKLLYLISTSLDGYVADIHGDFSWARPTEEVHTFVNTTLRNVGTILMGHNLYETMKVWDNIPSEGTNEFMDGQSRAMNEYAKMWHEAKKIVYSSTLTELSITNATIERSFDPSAIQELVENSAKDVDIGGPNLAAQAIKAGIVDEYHQIIVPVLVGNGNHWLPKDEAHELALVDTRTFQNGFVHLHYARV